VRRVLIAILLALSMCATAAETENNPLGISFLETPDVRLIYFDQLRYLVPHAAQTFTNALAWQRRQFNWSPSEKTTLVLKDFADYGNARATPAPHNTLVFDVAPNSRAFETYPGSERMYSFMNHETTHIATNDVSNDEDKRWRRFFAGKVNPVPQNPETLLYSYLTVPRYTAPRWYLEGAAVFMETWMDGGIGRAQGGYDEMVFRAMVRDGTRFYDPLGLVSRGVQVDFQIGANAYLYGTRFMTYLAYTYSPEKIVQWLSRPEGSKRYYADSFEQVFGLPLDRAWQDWIAFEHDFQQRNLAELRRNPLTPVKTLAATPLGSISRMYFDARTNDIYAAFRYPGFIEHIGALDIETGVERRLVDITGAKLYKVTSFAYDPAHGLAFFTDDNTGFRDLMVVDVNTGEQKLLLKDARIGEIAYNPADRSLMGVRHVAGLTQFVRIPFPYAQWQEINTFPYGSVPYDLDISPDGQLLSASMTESNADEFVRVWRLDSLIKGDLRPLSQFRFGTATPESFVFSPDGRYLYGSSYYTGVSNIYRYEVATGDVQVVSNTDIGLFRPVPLADGRLLVLAFTGEGFVPATIDPKPLADVSAITFLGAQLADKYPVVKTWQVPSPATARYDVLREGPYVPAKHLGVDNAYPVLQGYKNSIGFGYHVNVADPIQFLNLGATIAYTPTGHLPSEERPHVELTAQYVGWRGSLSWNRSDFYDIFGPVKRSRRGFAAKLGYDDYRIFEDPRKFIVSYDLEYYEHIDTLPNAQNVSTPFSRLLVGQVGLHYSDVQQSLGAVDDEKGYLWDVVAKANHARDETPLQVRANFDYGIPLPVANSSVWLRTAAGFSTGRRSDPLANFYFGAFGNNYVDNGAIKRYREYEAMPGFGIDEISALNFARELVEWNLPPVVFESVGTPALYLNWLRPAVFGAFLWTDPANKSRRSDYQSLGTQVDLRFHVLHWYDMTLSVGYALGFRGGKRAGDEVMVSLKIL
jgi:hypothetical protein